MTALKKGQEIADRLLELGVLALRLGAGLPKNPAARHVALQLVRSATGGGANYEEARAAESRADFVHKLSVAAKETRETCYWIDLIRRSGWVSGDLAALRQEAGDLAAILAASNRTARQQNRPK